MTCNILGSLWTQFCESCSCAFGKFCDCSKKNIIIIAQPTPESMEMIRDLIESSNTDLKTAVEAIQKKAWSTSTILLRTKDDEIDHKEEISLAILDVAFRFLEEVTDVPIINRKEKWQRLLTAGHLSAIDLEEKFKKNHPLNVQEAEILKEKVKYVRKFGSMAAFLWEMLKEEKVTSKRELQRVYRSRKINEKQREILSSLFKDYSELEILGKSTFSEVGLPARCAFLKAAEHSKKKEINDRKHTSWLGQQNQVDVPTSWDKVAQELKKQDGSLAGKNGDYLCQLRLEVLCLLSGINPQKMVEGTLTPLEIKQVRSFFPELHKSDGAASFLFYALHKVQEVEELSQHEACNAQLMRRIYIEFKLHPDLFDRVQSARGMSDLSAIDIAVIFKLARWLDADKKRRFNQQYKVADWIAVATADSGPQKGKSLDGSSDPGSDGSRLESDGAGADTPSDRGSPAESVRVLSRSSSEQEQKEIDRLAS